MRMAAQADSSYAASTDLAELLVTRGVPFREAHGIVGGKVRDALAGAGTFADLVAADPRLGSEAAALLQPGASVRNRTTHGSGGPAAVAAQLEAFRSRLVADEVRVG